MFYMDAVLSNAEELEKIKKAILRDGKEKFHVVTDFDRTLTTAFVNGKKVPSLISVLRNENYLTEEYSEKAKKLAEKYHAIELNPEIPLEEKKREMNNWWTKHFELLIKTGLNKKDVERVIKSGKVELRKGVLEFFDFLHENKIPVVIFSSNGLGEEAIAMYLEKERKRYDNVYIISNSFEWNEDGKAISVRKPIIHCMNKDETSIKRFPFYKNLKSRKNILLLGDTLEDIDMIKGFKYKNLIRVGFLNENIEQNLEKYKKAYDIIILNDGTFEQVNKLLREMIK